MLLLGDEYPCIVTVRWRRKQRVTSTILNINDQTVWSWYMQIWSRNTFLWPTYDQIELVIEAPSHLVYHDQSVILVIEVELFHDQRFFRHRSVFLLWPSQMVMKLVTEGDATWHGPCWLFTWQGACWHGYDDVALWHSATCRAAVCPCVELWMVHVSHSGLSTCRAAVCPRVALWMVHVSHSGLSTCRTQVCPRVALWFVHMSRSSCNTWLLLNAPHVSFQFHCQYTYNSQETGISAYITYSYDTSI
jgi:hypothetical protein